MPIKLDEELTYPDGLYRYIYGICFTHPIHIFMAFYCELYSCGLMGIILFMTSMNYWQRPYKKSIARTLDMICVFIIVSYHYYLALFAMNKLLCVGGNFIGYSDVPNQQLFTTEK